MSKLLDFDATDAALLYEDTVVEAANALLERIKAVAHKQKTLLIDGTVPPEVWRVLVTKSFRLDLVGGGGGHNPEPGRTRISWGNP